MNSEPMFKIDAAELTGMLRRSDNYYIRFSVDVTKGQEKVLHNFTGSTDILVN